MARCLAAIWLWSTVAAGLLMVDVLLHRCKHRLPAAAAQPVTDLYWGWFHSCYWGTDPGRWCDVRIRPVLSGGQGDGAARRALDDARRPGAAAGQQALQRAAARGAEDVACAAVEAIEVADARRRR